MMDFSMVITFALLQIIIQPAEVYSSQSIPAEDISVTERAEPSHLHHLFRRGAPAENPIQSNLEWKDLKPTEVTVFAVSVFDKFSKKKFYIGRLENCQPCFYEIDAKSCMVGEMYYTKQGDKFNLGSNIQNQKIVFLVNKDKFEIFEWKTSTYGVIPPLAVETCNGYFIARNEFGLSQMTENSLITFGDNTKVTPENEVLTLNRDIKGEHLTITEYNIVKSSEEIALLKQFTASNKNCEPVKHQVKLDQGIDTTISFLNTRAHLFGGTGEVSVGGSIFVVNAAGKFSAKYDHTRLNSKTTSTAEKHLHSVSMEVQVPANHACIIQITSNTFTADVKFTGVLTRTYNNNEIRRTVIDDTLTHQEIADIQVLVNRCIELSDGKKC